MPIHDWTRVPPGIYHSFHGRWIYALHDALNGGLLPGGYYALAEQTTRAFGPDILTLEHPGRAEPGANGTPSSPGSNGGAVAVALTPPKARFAVTDRPKPIPRPQRRLGIRHVSDHRMVALVELVSPGNKATRPALKTFTAKAAVVLDLKIHLLVLDPFPPGKRDPNGIHAAVWERVTGKSFSLPADKPLTLASYVAREEITAYVEPVAVGDPLPDMPLFLEPDLYVNVPLEPTYQAAWQTFPREWQTVLTAP